MSSINKVILIGHVGKDPEVRFSDKGTAFASCSLATSEKWKDKTTHESQEKVQWHRLCFFNRTAEIVGEYVKKGSKIYVEGKINYRTYTDKETNLEKQITEINVLSVQFLDSKGSNTGSTPANAPEGEHKPLEGDRGDFDDTIPF